MRRQQGQDWPSVVNYRCHEKKSSTFTIGIDLGDRKHAVCVLDARGEVVKQESITNSRPSLVALSRRYPGALMVMDASSYDGVGPADHKLGCCTSTWKRSTSE
jgi:hypothetical protein